MVTCNTQHLGMRSRLDPCRGATALESNAAELGYMNPKDDDGRGPDGQYSGCRSFFRGGNNRGAVQSSHHPSKELCPAGRIMPFPSPIAYRSIPGGLRLS
jgi:hypothetical protein